MNFTGSNMAWSWVATKLTLTIKINSDSSLIYMYPIKWENGEIKIVGNTHSREYWSHQAVKYISEQYKKQLTEQILREMLR